MPKTYVLFFAEEDGSVPILEWLDRLENKVQDKCIIKIERLEEKGYELHCPDADLLRDKIHELRVSLKGIQYRIFYFFFGKDAVITHGIVKKDKVPDREIELTIQRMIII